MPSFEAIPSARRWVIGGATVPLVTVSGLDLPAHEGLAAADIVVADGRIEAVTGPGEAPAELPRFSIDGGMVWPGFVDIHTHLDKGHIWERTANPDGSFMGALEAVKADREAFWSAADVRARMDFSLRCAFAHGTTLVRTHLDALAPQHRISFEVFDEMREIWADRIALQAAALIPLDLTADTAAFADLVAVVARHGGLLGGVTMPGPSLEADLERLFTAAAEHGLDVDLHVDETEDPSVNTLRVVAETVVRLGFPGRVTVGHCCALALQDEAEAEATIAVVAAAGLGVVSLPMCNLYLQDRHAGRTPRWRGVTLVHELAAAGVATAISSDNTRDPFYAFGDLDPVEVFRVGVRVLHLDHPLDTAARVVTTSPADIAGRPDLGRIRAGGPADLVLFKARRWSEFLSRPQSDRLVLRHGRPIDTTLPDHRELDFLARRPS